ncbi:MAG TPA: EamA family transporter [Spirochaetia bacterium]|nr:MAG: hypothetical protein A2Y41_08215 [Spirochaetes bacterium GWB1_36_13]HCL56925.1 EamA family transporter [Spirochaetia bacterium]
MFQFLSSYQKGLIFVVISAFCFAFLPVFAVFAYREGINRESLLFFRFLGASVLFAILLIVKIKKLRISFKEVFYFFILGGVFYMLQSNFYFASLNFISVSLAVVFLYTYPIFVALFSFIREKRNPGWMKITGITAGFSGLALILGIKNMDIRWEGVVLALGASIIYSAFTLFSNKVVKTVDPLISSAFLVFFAALSFFMIGMVEHKISFPSSWTVWGLIFGLAFFSSVLSILFYLVGMKKTNPTTASAISMLEPVFSILFALFLFQETLTFLQFSGIVITLSGTFLTAFSKEKNLKY